KCALRCEQSASIWSGRTFRAFRSTGILPGFCADGGWRRETCVQRACGKRYSGKRRLDRHVAHATGYDQRGVSSCLQQIAPWVELTAVRTASIRSDNGGKRVSVSV